MKTISLKKLTLSNGETLGYREREGGTKPILLIHGNMTSSKHWDVVLEGMPEEYKLFAVDLRGFGASTYNQPVCSMKDFAYDLKLFVDEIGLQDFTMVGWSTGGGVAMQFVVDYPSVCKKLILLASLSTRGYPYFGVNEMGQIDVTRRLKTIEEISQDPIRTIPIQSAYDRKDKEFLKRIWNATIYRDKQPSEEKYNEYVLDMLTQRNLVDVYQCNNLFNISDYDNGLGNGTGQAKEISIPVLVLQGETDVVISHQMAKEIVNDIGENATYVELKGCGHSPLVDDLEQLLSVMTEFLEQKEFSK
ncbi:alpha/beta hydrolase [Bacillus timonensis]|nr:alpha/beta hydrolase [Bacillus timonensis]